MTVTNQTPELITVTEAARRIGACSLTFKRRIARADIKADAILVEGIRQSRSALFDASRLPFIKKVLYPELP